MNAPESAADAGLDLQLEAYARRATRSKSRRSTAELLGYTAAAGGLAFAGGDAMGAIVHVNTQLSVSWNAVTATTSYNAIPWDINNNGEADAGLLVVGNTFLKGGAGPPGFFGFGGAGMAYFVPSASTNLAANLPASTSVSAGFLHFSLIFMGVSNGTVGTGGFLNTTGYAGFVFGDSTNPGPLYGWAKIRVDTDFSGPPSVKLTVFGWTYQDTPGVPIHIPVPGTPLLTLLGLGAMGIRGFRKRRDIGLKHLAEGQPERN